MSRTHVGEAGVFAVIGVGLLFHSVALAAIGGVFLLAAVGLVVPSLLPSRLPRRPASQPTPKPVAPLAPVIERIDNSALVRQLQGLRERGRAMIWEAGRSGVFIRLLGDQADAWYREVQLALDPSQRRRFTTAAGRFNTTSGLDISVSLDRHLAVLDEIINDMCYVPPAPSVEHMAYLMRRLGQSPVLPH